MDGTLDHTMMRVEDLEASLEFYRGHFGYEEIGRWEADTFTNVFLRAPDAHEDGAALELTDNHDDRTYDMGDSWGHVAVRVPEDELESSYRQLMDEGVDDYRDPESCDHRYAFVKDPDGHEIELVKRDYGAKWSLDHTMIRVEDANRALGWYVRTLDYDLVRRSEHDSFALYFVAPSDAPREATTVEMTYNYDGRSYGTGDAWGHLAVRTEDLEGTWEALMDRNAADYRDPESCGGAYAFTRDADGHEVEIVPR